MAANLQRGLLGQMFTLTEPAAMPERPLSPDRRIYTAIGAATGLAAGLLLFVASPRGPFRKPESTRRAAP